MKPEFSQCFQKIVKCQISLKSVQWELSSTMQTDRQSDMMKVIKVLSGRSCTKYFARKYTAKTMASTTASEVADLEICLNPMKYDLPFFRLERLYFLRSNSHRWIPLNFVGVRVILCVCVY